MKFLMLVPLILLISCGTPSGFQAKMADGSVVTVVHGGMVGGKRTVAMNMDLRTGKIKTMQSDNYENSFDTAAVGLSAYGAAREATKEILADTAAGVTNNKTAAGVTKFGLSEGTKRQAIEAGLSREAIRTGTTVIPR